MFYVSAQQRLVRTFRFKFPSTNGTGRREPSTLRARRSPQFLFLKPQIATEAGSIRSVSRHDSFKLRSATSKAPMSSDRKLNIVARQFGHHANLYIVQVKHSDRLIIAPRTATPCRKRPPPNYKSTSKVIIKRSNLKHGTYLGCRGSLTKIPGRRFA